MMPSARKERRGSVTDAVKRGGRDDPALASPSKGHSNRHSPPHHEFSGGDHSNEGSLPSSGTNSPTSRLFKLLRGLSGNKNEGGFEHVAEPPAPEPPLPLKSVASSAPMPMVVGEPICDVSVTVNVKLKMRGFLAVGEGDVVTLMEAQHVEPGMVVCRANGEVGKVPRSAVLLTKHSWNAYLEVLPWLVRHPAFLEQLLLSGFSAADLVVLLAGKNLLREALALLFQRELTEKAARHLENETFRQESPAMSVAAALLSMPAVREFRTSLVSLAVSALARSNGDADSLLHVLEHMFTQLERMAEMAPPELVILMQSLRRLGSNNSRLQASLFFLRFVCPALVQPVEVGGVAAVDEHVSHALILLAKAVQLVANQVEPAEGSFFFKGADKLRSFYPLVDVFLAKIARGMPVVHVSKSLVRQAGQLYAVVCQLTILPDSVEGVELARLQSQLGEPLASEEKMLQHPVLVQLRQKMAPFL